MSPDRMDGQSRTLKTVKETKKIKKPKIEDAINFGHLERQEHSNCRRRLNIDPPCRSNIDPGRVADF